MTQDELAELTRNHMTLAIADLGQPGTMPYGMPIDAANVAMLDGIARLAADYVMVAAKKNPISRAAAADWAARRIVSLVEKAQTGGNA